MVPGARRPAGFVPAGGRMAGPEKNTGLGLHFSREILSINGTTIRKTGEPGKGARPGMTGLKGALRFFLKDLKAHIIKVIR